MKMPKQWGHTRQERRVIKKRGGKALVKYGYDGKINGKPVEVRSCKKDKRYRIQKNTHKELIRKKGSYIFVNPVGKTKKVSASRVSKMIGRKKWYKDRDYPHKFVKKKQVFR